MKLVDKQNKFNSGVISTKLASRDDLSQYQNGVSKAINFICSKYGPIEKRVGTQFIEKSPYTLDRENRFVPFVLSVDKSLLLEFRSTSDNSGVMFVYKFEGADFGPLYASSTSTTPYSVSSNLLPGEKLMEAMSYTQSLDTMYMAFDGSRAPVIIQRKADTDWDVKTFSTMDGPYLDINFDTDIKLTIGDTTELTGSTSIVTCSEYIFYKARDINRWIRINTPHYNEATGAYEDRWSVGKIIGMITPSRSDYPEGDEGTLQYNADNAAASKGVYIKVKVRWTYRVQQYTIATGSTEKDYSEMTTPAVQWRLGAWGPTASLPDGFSGSYPYVRDYDCTYPTKVTIHQQRLVWSGVSNGRPWVWMSCSQAYSNYAPSDYVGTVTDSNAISVDISTEQLSSVKWMRSAQALLIGTELCELRAKSGGVALTPADCAFERDSAYGSYESDPVIVDDTFIFIQRLQRVLRGISYDDNAAAYRGPELTVLADNLTIGGIKKIVFQKQSLSVVWALREDGHLLSMTYDKDQQVTGWTECYLGGTDVEVLDMAVLPCAAYQQDVLILEVKRKINGEYVRYKEMLSRDFLDGLDRSEVPFLDCAIRHTDTAGFNVVYGDSLQYWLGETLRVYDKGAYVGEYHVTRVLDDNGHEQYGIELEQTCTDVWIGIPYDAYFETLERDFQSNQLSTAISKVRIHSLKVYLYRTLGLTIKKLSTGAPTVLATFSPLSRLDTIPQEISERVNVPIPSNWEPEYRLRFESEPGLPCSITGIVTGVEINAL